VDLRNWTKLFNRGLRLQRNAGRVQLTTAPELASIGGAFPWSGSDTHLSRAALETLAIIAYQQPVTRPQVDSIRGVNSDGMMKSLLSKGLFRNLVVQMARVVRFYTRPHLSSYSISV
jgi:segregation and condensation protein B